MGMIYYTCKGEIMRKLWHRKNSVHINASVAVNVCNCVCPHLRRCEFSWGVGMMEVEEKQRGKLPSTYQH